MTDLKIILASKSPRRSEILKNAGFEFTVRVSDADETLPDGISPEEAVQLLARKKAEVVKRNCGEMIIGADTVVVSDGKILGKPRDGGEAFSMLRALSGRTHFVYTGVCAVTEEKTETDFMKTEVEFLALSDEEISDYISSGEPFDKAGGYGVQGLASKFVKSIKGDYFSVVGLPISLIYEKFLKNH